MLFGNEASDLLPMSVSDPKIHFTFSKPLSKSSTNLLQKKGDHVIAETNITSLRLQVTFNNLEANPKTLKNPNLEVSTINIQTP